MTSTDRPPHNSLPRDSRHAAGWSPGPAFLALLTACGSDVPDRSLWMPLGDGVVRLGTALESHPRVREEQGGVWVSYSIVPEAWTPWEGEELFRAPRPHGQAAKKAHDEVVRLAVGDEEFPARLDLVRPSEIATLPPGTFGLLRDGIVIHCRDGLPPQEEAVFWTWYPRTSATSGTASIGRMSGRGQTVWPGDTWVHSIHYPPESALRFYGVALGLGLKDGESLEFRAALDGRELYSARQTATEKALGRWHTVKLPLKGGSGELVLQASGDLAMAAFLAPTIGPGKVGRHGTRPWANGKSERPNLILFLADTYRADNLSAWGGSSDISPNLDRIVERSLTFKRTWAPSTWTLPSQSSMFAGLFPPQHGAVDYGLSISSDLETIAERLAAVGYRTGAVTDSAFVSRRFNLHQGFEWFQENDPWNLKTTLAGTEEFLAGDDGRPIFLFVHTFRTHLPYRVGIEEDRRPLRELYSRVTGKSGATPEDGMLSSEGVVRELYELYLEGARGLDALVGPWILEIEAQGLLSPGTLIFTSDHGESFLEHGVLGHGGDPWEEQIHIPLFFLGDSIPPGSAGGLASLVDLPRTLAALAGVPPAREWEGQNLLEGGAVRTFSFKWGKTHSLVAVRRADRKVVALADPSALSLGEFFGAVELDKDPSEENEIEGAETWPGELLRENARTVEHLLRTIRPPVRIELPPSERLALEDIGYIGD